MIDVGTDHARLPAALVQRGVVPRAIASDIAPAPLAGAKLRIEAAGLSDRLEVRLTPGLSGLAATEASTAVIAGMGGSRIAAILDAAPLAFLTRLVVSPHTDVPLVRDALVRHGFAPLVDRVLAHGGNFYWMLAAERGPCDPDQLERLVGLVPADRRGPDYEAWLSAELVRVDDALVRAGPADQDDESRRRLRAQRSALLWCRSSR